MLQYNTLLMEPYRGPDETWISGQLQGRHAKAARFPALEEAVEIDIDREIGGVAVHLEQPQGRRHMHQIACASFNRAS
ncbi:MAG: hypothetical protein OEL53_17800 [Rhodospirillales bacterium]|nr:hypothetical protein [Rhodospirillales bacterium]